MSRDRAAYMRDYRAKKRGAPRPGVEDPDLGKSAERIAFLESEVARLKRELANRPGPAVMSERAVAAMHEFRPVPKPSQRGK